jgi:hypothetical protein
MRETSAIPKTSFDQLTTARDTRPAPRPVPRQTAEHRARDPGLPKSPRLGRLRQPIERRPTRGGGQPDARIPGGGPDSGE